MLRKKGKMEEKGRGKRKRDANKRPVVVIYFFGRNGSGGRKKERGEKRKRALPVGFNFSL